MCATLHCTVFSVLYDGDGDGGDPNENELNWNQPKKNAHTYTQRIDFISLVCLFACSMLITRSFS